MSDRTAFRPDVRLDDGPMQPICCRSCRAVVDVRKSSWEQTSIQWDAEAVSRCQETSREEDGSRRLAFDGCWKLTESIRSAVTDGSLHVQIGGPLPVNNEPDNP